MNTLHVADSRGSVLVLTAFAMFPIMFLLAFAIDISHWFDYSRNLQNRADAAALAAGAAFGNVCLEGANPGDTTTGAQSVIGKWAQLYSGAGTGEPAGRLPYLDTAVAAGTGWNVAQNGYINNTKSITSPVQSPLTLRAGSLNDYWLVLNGEDYAENGGTSFSMLPAGTGATFCNSDPTQDLTDPNRASAGAAGPLVDVKVSQRNLPLFFPLIGTKPNIHAHARVQLQGESSSPTTPIAVSDSGFAPCVSVDFVNVSTNVVIQTVTLTKETQVNPSDPITWDNVSAPASIPMPAANVYVQPYLSNCNGSGQRYDDSTNSGLLYVNTFGNPPTPTATQPPVLSSGGVTLGGTCASGTQYLSVGDCNVQVTAHVAFSVANSKAAVTAVDMNTGDTLVLNPDAAGTTWTPNGNNHLTIGDQSGQHPIRIDWTQKDNSVSGVTCTPANPCTGSFLVQAQAFGACNGCDQPDDSGPIVFARISEGASLDVNAFAQGSTHNLVVTVKLAGLSAAKAGDPATVLRFPTSGNHQTGLVDCGQGSGTSADADVVYYGCGPQNPKFSPPLNPLFVNTRNTCGTPPGAPWPSGNHQDCVQSTPGTRRQGIICTLVDRIVGAPENNNCNNNGVGTCTTNHWPTLDGQPDPRAVTMIITSAADLAAGAGSPQAWLPVRRFATFYITGWDSAIKPQCADNETFPAKGKNNQQNAAVWGHWTSYVDLGGIGDNQNCPVNSAQPVNCVPVLTR